MRRRRSLKSLTADHRTRTSPPRRPSAFTGHLFGLSPTVWFLQPDIKAGHDTVEQPTVHELQSNAAAPKHVQELMVAYAAHLAAVALDVAKDYDAVRQVNWHHINQRVKTRLAKLWREAAAEDARVARQIEERMSRI